ncbi:class F sortase [Streptomyces coelicoflavus]|uniref:Class F sortase n=1 Tax=Streptomyces coelicoflavus TaxID=285562 RepID=A0A6N9UIR9_9ACTN|nr:MULTISPECIES: class F sortase [Streptomyces]EHN78395.1 secreted protein [Streptomyces coelicoflavus ZG0656]KPC76597.1 peptidase C60 [Streptomyces sp. NRRL WC-3753]MZE46322.1 class F sortase [Streptomyces sp. SID5477]NEB17475.1 class F sortase [Streptomyces coelicoflavus]OWA22203.1 class F sortase [Streptomyces sp. CS159]
MYDSELAEEEERRRKRAPWGVIALVLLTGLALIRNGSGEFDVGPPQPASAAAPDTRTAPGEAAASGVTPLPYSVPDQVSIPAIQVDAPVMGVGLDPDGWVDAPPPEDPNLAGWFTGAVTPGEKGTSVVVGHVDNQQGPAVFYGLGALKKGNKVEVHRQDGKTAVFEVYGIEVFETNNFPGDRVYGSKGTPELRVITCGGGFTKENGYDGNVVVFARLVEVR